MQIQSTSALVSNAVTPVVTAAVPSKAWIAMEHPIKKMVGGAALASTAAVVATGTVSSVWKELVDKVTHVGINSFNILGSDFIAPALLTGALLPWVPPIARKIPQAWKYMFG